MRKITIMLALCAMLVFTAVASAAKPGAPSPNKGGGVPKGAFNQLKQTVAKQGARIKVLEDQMSWYEACTQYALDVGEVLDIYVAPGFIIAGYSWVPLDNADMWALSVAAECVDVSSTASTGSGYKSIEPGIGFLERIR